MRLRYHKEEGNRGLILLESEPQIRTVFCYSQTGATARLAFPYILSAICYTKLNGTIPLVSSPTYHFGGIYKLGLRVFLRNTPLETAQDRVFYSPTDWERRGLVCTPHQNDNKNFNSLQELTTFVIGMWWNTVHNINNLQEWRSLTLENAVKHNWSDAGTLQDAMSMGCNYSGYGKGYDIPIPKDAILANEPWPNK